VWGSQSWLQPAFEPAQSDWQSARPTFEAVSYRLATSRIEVLKQLLEHDPASTFARYGLAMEFVKAGELEAAVAEFKAIAAADPGYSAAYFHGGQAMEKLGRIEDARDLYRRGIAQTRDAHAAAELQAALDILGD
jgi:tetratricopeptide (TPR) repeat protein